MECPECGREVVLTDYPINAIYHSEDTEWGIPPEETGDPGWLVPKAGAKPIYVGCDKEKIHEVC